MSRLFMPFRGWRYDPEQVGDLGEVLAPPYDIVSLPLQAELCLRSPYNIVHLDLGEPGGPASGDPHRYAQAAELWARWQAEGVFRRDAEPCFYLYEAQYRDPLGQPRVQRGVLGAVRVHDYEDRVVLPHEGTLKGPKADRLALMETCRCAFSQIFALYDDPELRVEALTSSVSDQQPPYFDVTDPQGVRHRMWVISDPEVVEALSAALEGQQIVIADGHHRYETALAYRNRRREAGESDPGAPAERVTMFLANVQSSELTIVAAHRMLEKLPPATWDRLATCPARPFEVVNLVLPSGSDEEVAHLLVEMLARWRERGTAIVAYGPERRAYLLHLPREAPLPTDFGPDHSETWRRLDVAILHNLVLTQLLGLSGEYIESGENITFTRDPVEAVSLVETGKQQMALLLNPTRVEQVMAISAAGDRMPQKGTYFFPKLLAGIVLYDLETL